MKGVLEWGHDRDRQTDRQTEQRRGKRQETRKTREAKEEKRSQEKQGWSKRQESELCLAGGHF